MTCVEAEKMVVPYMKDELSPTELEDFLELPGGAGDPLYGGCGFKKAG